MRFQINTPPRSQLVTAFLHDSRTLLCEIGRIDFHLAAGDEQGQGLGGIVLRLIALPTVEINVLTPFSVIVELLVDNKNMCTSSIRNDKVKNIGRILNILKNGTLT